MLVFPQLSSGANVQYPLVRSDAARTVINTLPDGTTIKFEDVSAGRIHWILPLSSLDGAERLALEQLFLATEGELNSFTLLDPASNLLAWSEDFAQSVWVADPLIEKTGGMADPLGGTAAWQMTNSGIASQQIGQQIEGPSGFEYCFSAHVQGSGAIHLVRSGGGASSTSTFALTNSWQRISTAGSLSATGATFKVDVALDAGGTVQIFGPQLEAQPAAGPYRRSLGSSGVYSVRFESNLLNSDAVGLDRYSSVIRLLSVEQ
jgi:hypothetical protein